MIDAVHVHRSSDWFDSEHLPIPRAEWYAYAATQDDISPGTDGIVLWSGHPDGVAVELDWVDGRISAYEPDAATLERLAVIARDLGAVLQGDDCEVYGGDPALLEQDAPDPVISSIPSSVEIAPVEIETGGPTSRAEFLRGILRRP
jgi:hypothetical protein